MNVPLCQICPLAAQHSVAFDNCWPLPRGHRELVWYPLCNLCLPREQERMRGLPAHIKFGFYPS